MKRIQILFLSMLLFGKLTHSQSNIGNGGDAFAAEFIASARDTVQYFSWVSLSDLPEFNPLAFAQSVEKVKVSSLPRVFVGQTEVGAANYPNKQQIVVSQSFWPKYNQNQRMVLVLHEYLGVMGVNDTNYRLSGIVYQRIQQASTTPNGRPIAITLTELVGGYVLDATVPNSKVLSQESYKSECASWSGAAKKSLGTALGAIACGQPNSVGNRWQWGFRSSGEITFFSKYRPTIVRQTIEGVRVHGQGNASIEAIESHKQACAKWKKDVASAAGKNLLYASCGGVTESPEIDAYQFYSTGIILLLAPNRTQLR
jgi:hypothetical protein